MESFNAKGKAPFLLYEFLGTAILTVAYNLSEKTLLPFVLFFVSLMAWELSSAHFNIALTIGSLIVEPAKIVSNIVPFLAIIFVQFCGSLFGILLTYICSKVTYPSEETKDIFPKVSVLCPLNEFYSYDCTMKHLEFHVFAMEAIASFIFVFTWLHIKRLQFTGDLRRVQNVIKPVFVMLMYQGTITLS